MTDAEVIAACQKELGYQSGDLLHNVQRYKRCALGEIDRLRQGSARLVRYAGQLQEMIPPENVARVAREAIEEKISKS